jgi:hypothetical protein
MENIKKLDELKWKSALPGANPASAELKISYNLKILQRYTRRVLSDLRILAPNMLYVWVRIIENINHTLPDTRPEPWGKPANLIRH